MQYVRMLMPFFLIVIGINLVETHKLGAVPMIALGTVIVLGLFVAYKLFVLRTHRLG